MILQMTSECELADSYESISAYGHVSSTTESNPSVLLATAPFFQHHVLPVTGCRGERCRCPAQTPAKSNLL